jgi:hypothetical protein
MGRVFGNDKLKPRHARDRHCSSGGQKKSKIKGETDLIQLITEIYWVDIIAFQVGEHDDLSEKKTINLRNWKTKDARRKPW